MKAYIGTKVIMADPMTKAEAARLGLVRDVPIGRLIGSDEGYRVEYPDGYVSWSPKAAFEAAYRLVSEDELAMLGGCSAGMNLDEMSKRERLQRLAEVVTHATQALAPPGPDPVIDAAARTRIMQIEADLAFVAQLLRTLL